MSHLLWSDLVSDDHYLISRLPCTEFASIDLQYPTAKPATQFCVNRTMSSSTIISLVDVIPRLMSTRLIIRSATGAALVLFFGSTFFLISYNLVGFVFRLLVGLSVYRWYYYKQRRGSHPFDLGTKETIGGLCIPLLDERNGASRMPEHRHWWDWNKCSGSNNGWKDSRASRVVRSFWDRRYSYIISLTSQTG